MHPLLGEMPVSQYHHATTFVGRPFCDDKGLVLAVVVALVDGPLSAIDIRTENILFQPRVKRSRVGRH